MVIFDIILAAKSEILKMLKHLRGMSPKVIYCLRNITNKNAERHFIVFKKLIISNQCIVIITRSGA